MKIRVSIDLKVNRLVRDFVLVDLVLLAGWGLIAPILSVFVVEHVAGATLVTVGTGTLIYWILKSLLALPIASYLDKTPGERDDLWMLIVGLFIIACSAFSLGLVTKIWQFYAAYVLQGIGFSFYGASWPAIFSRHLDKDRISFDWALDNTAVGISTGVSGFLGSILASWFGFPSVFFLAALFCLFSAIILLMAPDLVLPPPTTKSQGPIGERPPMYTGK